MQVFIGLEAHLMLEKDVKATLTDLDQQFRPKTALLVFESIAERIGNDAAAAGA